MSELAEIKKSLFYRLLEDAGRVFIHIRPSMELEIGRRGLLGEELKSGITLVFNSHMNFDWGDYGIEATLVFGSTPEKCFIPAEAIDAVYSPELKVQLLMEQDDGSSVKNNWPAAGGMKKAPESSPVKTREEGNVIEVDFHRRKDN